MALALEPAAAQRIQGMGTPDDDLNFATGHLRKSRMAFVAAINGLSDAQWNYKPGPGKWSIAECAEHIAVAEQELLQLVRRTSVTPLDPAMVLPGKGFDQEVIKIYLNRDVKAQAPETLKPSNRYKDATALRQDFWQNRTDTIRFAETSNANLREHGEMHSMLKRPLDGVQWLLVISAHTERHTAQIEEVKASAGYPK